MKSITLLYDLNLFSLFIDIELIFLDDTKGIETEGKGKRSTYA